MSMTFTSLAFPSISTGAYGYPMEERLKIALKTSLEQLDRFRKLAESFLCCFQMQLWMCSREPTRPYDSYCVLVRVRCMNTMRA